VTRVLLVEDEESVSDALSYLLRKQGFEVATCPTGHDALDAFGQHGADLVLLDLMLPGALGTEVCQRLRERSSVPVIILSAKDTEADKAIGLELGADDYVTKPFSWPELAARIRAVHWRRNTSRGISGDSARAQPVHPHRLGRWGKEPPSSPPRT
jgi:two-component system, OmpR family, response regulator RegX3